MLFMLVSNMHLSKSPVPYIHFSEIHSMNYWNSEVWGHIQCKDGAGVGTWWLLYVQHQGQA
jgi:hypothetical protein